MESTCRDGGRQVIPDYLMPIVFAAFYLWSIRIMASLRARWMDAERRAEDAEARLAELGRLIDARRQSELESSNG